MGTTSVNSNFNLECYLNMDNTISAADLDILNNHFGETT